MIHITYFRNILREIFKNKKDIEFVENFYNRAQEVINIYRCKVLELKFKLKNKELVILDPLGEIFSKFEVLERNLVCIYYITKFFPNSENIFTNKDLAVTLGKEREYFRSTGRASGKRQELLNEKYIELIKSIVGGVPLFKIAEKGTIYAKKIIDIKFKKYVNDFRNLIDFWKKNYEDIKRPIREIIFRTLIKGDYTNRQLNNITGFSLDQIRSATGDLRRSGDILEMETRYKERVWRASLKPIDYQQSNQKEYKKKYRNK